MLLVVAINIGLGGAVGAFEVAASSKKVAKSMMFSLESSSVDDEVFGDDMTVLRSGATACITDAFISENTRENPPSVFSTGDTPVSTPKRAGILNT